MPNQNFLERIVAEWLDYQGLFVKTNVAYGRRAAGGFKGEMDVIGFDALTGTLSHYEVSGDALSWAKRAAAFRRKFESARAYYSKVFKVKIVKVRRIAVVGYARRRPDPWDVDCELILIPDLIKQITDELRKFEPTSKAIPEKYGILRAMQFSFWYGGD